MTIEQILAYIIPIFIWIVTITITLRLVIKKQSVPTMLSWLIVIYVFPVVGIIAYLIFGEINLGKHRAAMFEQLKPKYMNWFNRLSHCDNLVNTQTNLLYRPIFDLANQRLGVPCILGNELHILDTPESIMRSIIHDINQAEKSINMVFYIWSAQGLVSEVTQALINARQRGVAIHILLDSVGSRAFLKSTECQVMRDNGIEVMETLHVNLFRMFFNRIDLRQHRKIIVIDNQISYTGSMNMVDPKFFKKDSNVGEWIDIMVRINGPVSAVLNGLHAWDWEIETRVKLPLEEPDCPLLPLEQNNSHAVQILATGPCFPDDLMVQSLAIAIFSARKSIVITSPYFVPSHNIAEALRIAALRGVEVSIIIPKENDSLMVHWASRTFFDDLLAAGVKIYHFNQGLLHTKSMLIDNRLALVGTVNMDMRSFYLNLEVSLAVFTPETVAAISALLDGYLAGSEAVELKKWQQRRRVQRFIERCVRLVSPLL